MSRFTVAVAMVAGVLLAGCYDDTDHDLGSASHHIAGADDVASVLSAPIDPVCSMKILRPNDDMGEEQDPLWCACTLIGPQTIITAASCVEENVDKDKVAAEDIEIRFGLSHSAGTEAEHTTIELHRYYSADQRGVNDLALIRLMEAPVGVTPATLSDVAMSGNDVASDACDDGVGMGLPDVAGCVVMIGYGKTKDGEPDTAFGAKRAVVGAINTVSDFTFFAGRVQATTCEGDSGAPVFRKVGDDWHVIGITSLQGRCTENVQRTRVDRFTSEFIYRYLDRFSGPCMVDSTCVETGCRSPDPDCDDCAWGNTCNEECPTRDWDCELGAFVGADCTENGQCEEGGTCDPAEDDDTYLFCSRPCDPADEASCPSNMRCNEGACTFLTPSPGSQGFACAANRECRSGICEETICVNECDPTASDSCPDPFVCGPSTEASGKNVCLGDIVSGGGGFCAADGRGAGLVLLAVLLVGLSTRRRRRSGAVTLGS